MDSKMVYQGDPTQANRNRPLQPTPPPQQQPLHPAYNNGISYNTNTDQSTTGQTTPQPNQTGVPYANLNSSYTQNYGRGGGYVTYNPPVSTPTPVPTPAPTGYDKYNPATWWWRMTPDANGMANGYNTNAVPMGNFPQPTPGIQTWTNPNTGLQQFGPGQGMQLAPAGSPVAFVPSQQFGFGGFNPGQAFPGLNYGFFNDQNRGRFG